jgi:site-specific DNA recombinase
MYVPTNTPKYVCMSCRNKIPIVDLEAVFIEELKNFVVTPGEVNAHLEKANTNIAEKERLLATIQGEHDKVAADVEGIYRLYKDGKIDGDGFGRFYRPLQERQAQLDNELPRLQAEVDLLKINQISSEQVITEVTDLHRRWPSLEREEKHRIIESITEKIIGYGEIDINLYHVVSSEELTKGLRSL